MPSLYKSKWAAFFAVGLFALSANSKLHAQAKAADPEECFVDTVDGLRLMGTWYAGGLGKNSDCVIMLHASNSNTQKGPWAPFAQALQAKGFSVLTFDQRGHGKSTTNKTIRDAKLFADNQLFPFNRLSGLPVTQPSTIKSISADKFKPGYYPYLINDLVAARRFLDIRNDAGECNVGRIHIIADRDAATFALLWTGFEWTRNGVNPVAPGVQPPNHNAGTDVMSLIFLSPRPAPVTVIGTAMNKAINDKEAATGIKEKVAMAFVTNTDAEKGNEIAGRFFQKWAIKPGAKEDRELGKYIIETKGGKFAGIDLMDEKLDTTEQVLKFITATKKKNANGNDWKNRNATVLDAFPFPTKLYGIP